MFALRSPITVAITFLFRQGRENAVVVVEGYTEQHGKTCIVAQIPPISTSRLFEADRIESVRMGGGQVMTRHEFVQLICAHSIQIADDDILADLHREISFSHTDIMPGNAEVSGPVTRFKEFPVFPAMLVFGAGALAYFLVWYLR